MMHIDEITYNQFINELGKEDGKIILEIFIEEVDDYIEQIKETNDYEIIRTVMHQLKSTSRIFGAHILGDKAALMEANAKEKNDTVFHEIPVIIEFIYEVKDEFKKRIPLLVD